MDELQNMMLQVGHVSFTCLDKFETEADGCQLPMIHWNRDYCNRWNLKLVNSRAGYHQLPCDNTLSQYFAHDNDNITIQQFCDNRYIARNVIHILHISRYLCPWRNSEFIDCTESISQELQNIVNQFHINDSQVKQSVYCTVAFFNTHTDCNLIIIKYQYLVPVYR